jgi:hypothetical protein
MKSKTERRFLDLTPEEQRAEMDKLVKVYHENPLQKPWTDKEDQILLNLYGRVPAREIAVLLERTIDSVNDRTKRLRLKGIVENRHPVHHFGGRT